MADYWQDDEAVIKISNDVAQAVEKLVDQTARAAIVDFVEGDEIFIILSSVRPDKLEPTVSVSCDNINAQSKGEKLIDLLEEAIESEREWAELDGAVVDSPYAAMRDAYMTWLQNRPCQKS